MNLNLHFETNFTIMPANCNYMTPLVFGGFMMEQIDLAAASCVSRLLHASECDSAVTYMVDKLIFHGPSYMGDLIFLECNVIELRLRAIVVEVKGWREERCKEGRTHILDAKLVFVTKKDGKFQDHGLSL